jgi:hypothetical protein
MSVASFTPRTVATKWSALALLRLFKEARYRYM